jgi:ribosomal protein S18 acetylase RimI-like enzyme
LSFVIREASTTDISSILDLWKAAEATESVTDDPAALTRVIERQDSAVLVAEIDGELIGSVIGTFDGWRGNVYRLAVHPAKRRLGIARGLAAALDKRFASLGAKRVTALVEKAHRDAVGFWRSTPYLHDERIIRYVRTVPDGETA